MNWMTSGRHRALRTTRGKKRAERTFPAHIQRRQQIAQRARAIEEHAPRCEGAETAGEPWYVRSVMDDSESHDVVMLEFSRKSAAMASTISPQRPATPPPVSNIILKRAEPSGEQSAGSASADKRCVFTPVKASRQRPRRQHQHQQNTNTQRVAADTSSPTNGILLFNEGNALSHGKASSTPAMAHQTQIHTTRPIDASSAEQRSPLPSVGFQRWTTAESERGSNYTESVPFYDDDHRPAETTFSEISYGGSSRVPFFMKSGPPTDFDALSVEDATRYDSSEEIKMPIRPTERDDEAHVGSGDALLPLASREHITPRYSCNDSPIWTEEVQIKSTPGSQRAPPSRVQHEWTPPMFTHKDSTTWTRPETKGMLMKRTLPSQTNNQLNGNQDLISPPSPGGTAQSTSSQGSIVIPPPIDWHKNLAKHVSEGPGHHCSPVQVSTTSQSARHSSAFEFPRPDVGKASWTMAPRTHKILCQVCDAEDESPETKHSDVRQSIAYLRLRAQKKEELAIYMFTLVQCHRINELVSQEPPPPAIEEE